MKNTAIGLLFTLVVIFGVWIYQREFTFQVSKIQSDAAPSSLWNVQSGRELDQAELRELFSHPFLYLGKGAQCYAFVSQDGGHILKLFKQHHLNPHHWLEGIPMESVQRYVRKKIANRVERRQLLFNSCKLAYQEIPEHTGVLYLHLNKTPGLFCQQVRIQDRFGKVHTIDIDDYEFLIQERATPATVWLTSRIQEGHWDKAKEGVNQILDMIAQRCKRGISDQDPAFAQNYGFSKRGAIHMDIGRFEPYPLVKERPFFDAELQRITHQFRDWIVEEQPELLEHFQERLREILDELPQSEGPQESGHYCLEDQQSGTKLAA